MRRTAPEASVEGGGGQREGVDSRPDATAEPRPAEPRPAPARPRRRLPGRALALGLVVPLGLLALWQWAATAGFYNAAQLPPPLTVARAFAGLVERGDMWLHLAISLQRVLLGFAWGAVIGLVVGGLVGLVTPVLQLLAPTVQAVRAVPSLAWVPLLVLWLGIGEGPKVVLIAIGAFFPVYTTVSSALAHQDRHLVEVGRAYGLRGIELFTRVLLPASAPSVLAGLRLALAQSWLFVVAAELIASTMGLGFLLTNSQNTGRTDILLLAIVLLAVCGKTTDAVLGAVERRVAARR